MDISYVKGSSFKVKAKNGTVVTNSDSLVISHKAGGEDFLIKGPGEYEVEGISVFGYRSNEDDIYVVQFEDVRVLYLGNLTKPLSEKAITELENIDVVIAPTDTMPIKDLIELISKLEPYYVLPYGEMKDKFIAGYEHSSRSVKSLSLSKVGFNEDLTEVIVFE